MAMLRSDRYQDQVTRRTRANTITISHQPELRMPTIPHTIAAETQSANDTR
jgi:hypothetical protein